MKKPSLDKWLAEAKNDPSAGNCGSYVFHDGAVRRTPRSEVRDGAGDGREVTAMRFSYDEEAVMSAVEKARALPGIYYVRIWLNKGVLQVGDDIMLILIGGDIRPRALHALDFLLNEVKGRCVSEEEIYI